MLRSEGSIERGRALNAHGTRWDASQRHSGRGQLSGSGWEGRDEPCGGSASSVSECVVHYPPTVVPWALNVHL